MLWSKLWCDDTGAVLTAEYLTLGAVVVLGGVAGLTAMSNQLNEELKGFAHSVGNAVRVNRPAKSNQPTPESPATGQPVVAPTVRQADSQRREEVIPADCNATP